eukprot:gnl/Chilomastix_cuspidata/2174.p1 GENE.gnl/Chilomastix_cuspidata/2174~~gnl/Chilomastix_cuspidata/2174.p1  ORF type:complete len:996 (-),score=274.81 gnl/Chilomastix_cuspidata/2174:41-3028(-)
MSGPTPYSPSPQLSFEKLGQIIRAQDEHIRKQEETIRNLSQRNSSLEMSFTQSQRTVAQDPDVQHTQAKIQYLEDQLVTLLKERDALASQLESQAQATGPGGTQFLLERDSYARELGAVRSILEEHLRTEGRGAGSLLDLAPLLRQTLRASEERGEVDKRRFEAEIDRLQAELRRYQAGGHPRADESNAARAVHGPSAAHSGQVETLLHELDATRRDLATAEETYLQERTRLQELISDRDTEIDTLKLQLAERQGAGADTAWEEKHGEHAASGDASEFAELLEKVRGEFGDEMARRDAEASALRDENEAMRAEIAQLRDVLSRRGDTSWEAREALGDAERNLRESAAKLKVFLSQALSEAAPGAPGAALAAGAAEARQAEQQQLTQLQQRHSEELSTQFDLIASLRAELALEKRRAEQLQGEACASLERLKEENVASSAATRALSESMATHTRRLEELADGAARASETFREMQGAQEKLLATAKPSEAAESVERLVERLRAAETSRFAALQAQVARNASLDEELKAVRRQLLEETRSFETRIELLQNELTSARSRCEVLEGDTERVRSENSSLHERMEKLQSDGARATHAAVEELQRTATELEAAHTAALGQQKQISALKEDLSRAVENRLVIVRGGAFPTHFASPQNPESGSSPEHAAGEMHTFMDFLDQCAAQMREQHECIQREMGNLLGKVRAAAEVSQATCATVSARLDEQGRREKQLEAAAVPSSEAAETLRTVSEIREKLENVFEQARAHTRRLESGVKNHQELRLRLEKLQEEARDSSRHSAERMSKAAANLSGIISSLNGAMDRLVLDKERAATREPPAVVAENTRLRKQVARLSAELRAEQERLREVTEGGRGPQPGELELLRADLRRSSETVHVRDKMIEALKCDAQQASARHVSEAQRANAEKRKLRAEVSSLKKELIKVKRETTALWQERMARAQRMAQQREAALRAQLDELEARRSQVPPDMTSRSGGVPVIRTSLGRDVFD